VDNLFGVVNPVSAQFRQRLGVSAVLSRFVVCQCTNKRGHGSPKQLSFQLVHGHSSAPCLRVWGVVEGEKRHAADSHSG
jgi:hypothetical protein